MSETPVRVRRPAASPSFRGALIAMGILAVGLFVGGLGLAWARATVSSRFAWEGFIRSFHHFLGSFLKRS